MQKEWFDPLLGRAWGLPWLSFEDVGGLRVAQGWVWGMCIHPLECLRPRAHCALQMPTSREGPEGMSVCPPYLAAGVLGGQSAPGRIPYLHGFGMNLVLPLMPQHPTLIGAESQGSPHARPKRGSNHSFCKSTLAGGGRPGGCSVSQGVFLGCSHFCLMKMDS